MRASRSVLESVKATALAVLKSVALAILLSAVSTSASGAAADGLVLEDPLLLPEFLPPESVGKRRKRRIERPCHTLAATRTFLQLRSNHAHWTLRDWRTLFGRYTDLGFTEVILQWTSIGDFTVYADNDAELSSVLEKIVLAARETGIRMWVGLHQESPTTLARRDRGADWYGERLHQHQEKLLPLTLSLLSHDPNGVVFRGWYITDELDSQNWHDDQSNDAFSRYLKDLRNMLERVQPAWPVMISGYVDRERDVHATAARWGSVLQDSRIDIVLVHDGVGAGKLTISDLKHWLPILAGALEDEHRTLGVIVEIFDSTPAEITLPTPASFARVIEQLNMARAYGREPLTVFSVTDYLRNDADLLKRRLYRRWQLDHRECRGSPRRLAMR